MIAAKDAPSIRLKAHLRRLGFNPAQFRQSKGKPTKRKLKPNRLHVSRRVRRIAGPPRQDLALVVLDDADSGASAKYGLSGFPYFVMLDGEGKVVARGSGEIPMDVFGPAVDALAAGNDPIAAAG